MKKHRYKVRCYQATAWGVFTQADHYEDHYFASSESLDQVAKRLARDGFRVSDTNKWIMPGAILTVERED
jgi:hypothetical protein